MMKKLQFIMFIVLLTFGAVACSTKASYIHTPGAAHIDPSSKFSVGEIVDRTGFSFPADESDKFELNEAMSSALKKALENKTALGDETQYTINVVLVAYAPGNAFHRWLLPGLGETKLNVVASVVDLEGREIAKIPVERSIAAGGGYTIGAFKYVFDEVAMAIVDLLIDPSKRVST
jgi:hypothetical protein